LIVTSTTPLTWCRLSKREGGPGDRLYRLYTAIILGMEEIPECLAVVVSTHKLPTTVSILFTVSLTLYTRGAWAATSSSIKVATTAPWATLYFCSTWGLWLHTTVVLGMEEIPESLAVIIPTNHIPITVSIVFTVSLTLYTRGEY